MAILNNKLNMDLSKFKESNKSDVKKSNVVISQLNNVKNWILPPTNDKRKERLGQYKDIGIFVGSIGLVIYFKESISQFL